MFAIYLVQKKLKKKLLTLFLKSTKDYSVKKMNLQCNACSHALSYSFSSTLINSITISCIFNLLEFFYNILKANQYTLDLCIMHCKSHLNVYNMWKQTQKYACIKKRHCILFLVFISKNKTLYYPLGRSTLLVVCRNMSSIKSGCKRLNGKVLLYKPQ